MKEHIGQGIKHFREKIDWSQRQLAAKAGVSHSLVAGIEKGEINPSLNTLTKLSDVLHVPVSQFFLTIEYSQTTQKEKGASNE